MLCFIRLSDAANYKFLRIKILENELVDIEPKSAIMQAFRILESSIAEAAVKFLPDNTTKAFTSTVGLGLLLKNTQIISEADFTFFNQLRKLRNSVLHFDKFQLPTDLVNKYCDIAIDMAESLRNK